MAALNKTETEVLRSIEGLLKHVFMNGYNPTHNLESSGATKEERALAKTVRELLLQKQKELNTIIQMKGYYPK